MLVALTGIGATSGLVGREQEAGESDGAAGASARSHQTRMTVSRSGRAGPGPAHAQREPLLDRRRDPRNGCVAGVDEAPDLGVI